MTDDGDRLTILERAFREPASDAATASGCPDADTLRASATLEAGAAVRRDVLDHVATCPACSVAWVAVRELISSADAPTRSANSGRAIASLAAAAVLAIAFLVLPDAGTDRVPDEAWRATGAAIDWSSVPDEVPLAAVGGRLSWPSGPAGSRYRVRLTTVELDPVASANGLTESWWEVPSESVASLAPGTVVLWQVVASAPDGRSATSPTFRARIGPRAP